MKKWLRKKCTQCGVVQGKSEFYIRSSGRPYAECRTCFKRRVTLNRAGRTSARYVRYF